MRPIITRREARERGLRRFFTGRPCKRGHVAERRIDNGECVECARERANRHYTANKERHLEWQRNYDAVNKEHLREWQRAYRAKNEDRLRKQSREWYLANRQTVLSKQSKYNRAWDAANRGKVNGYQRARTLAKVQRTPQWLTDAQWRAIEDVYIEADRLTLETGAVHHVDHRVPIKCKDRATGEVIASGLHVPLNLVAVPGAENLSRNCYVDRDVIDAEQLALTRNCLAALRR